MKSLEPFLALLSTIPDPRRAVASRTVWEIAGGASERFERNRSGGGVNGLISRLFGEGFPAVDLAHGDLA